MSTRASEQLVLGRYRIVQHLFQGGMGVVYLGRVEGAAGFAKPVIIKRIIPGTENADQSTGPFIREAQILSHLQHPGIVGVLDFGREADGYVMVLEYVHGYDLARWLRYLHVKSERLHWEEGVLTLLRVLDALHYAHCFQRSDGSAAGVLHRDISPANILLDLEGQVRLLDFGIARMAHGDIGEYKTGEGVLKGKIPFLAPELFSMAPASVSSDVYACGVVLYRTLTGAHPFAAEDQNKLMRRILSESPRPPRELVKGLPPELETCLLRCLEKGPEDRYPSAEAFAQALRNTLRRSETEIHSDLRAHIRQDFSGDMPSVLDLVPLHEREQAWRQAQRPAPFPPVPLHSSPLPPAPKSQPATRAIEAPSSVPLRPAPRSGSLRLPVLMVGAALALALLSALVLLMNRQPPAPTGSRFIVVESPDRSATQADALAALATTPPDVALEPRPAAPEAAPSMPRGAPAATRPTAAPSDAAALSRQLAQRQGALEGCFERHAAELQGSPELSVAFDVDVSGRVTAAALTPPALTETQLGQCLLAIARETRFDKQPKPVRFSIPLRARAITR
jgi:serine/threonine protein kinase